jgi:hypothetical protein
MSTIIATTLSNGSASVPTATVVNGSAKAWVNFNGTGTVAIRDSFNVASLTDTGVGNYSVNFSSSMANSGYSVGSAVDQISPFPIIQAYLGSVQTGLVALNVAQPNTADFDTTSVHGQVSGDLA